jgi:hypothetical protein
MEYYADYEFYNSIYGKNSVPEADFNRLVWTAQKKVDDLTFGKLKTAFPEDEYSIEAVRRCLCAVVDLTAKIESAEERVEQGQGYVTDKTTGATRGKVVSSVSSGSESVSYTAKAESGSTVIDTVLSDKNAQDKLYNDTIKQYLNGVRDANGVNLLYAGMPYPGRPRKSIAWD